MACSVISIGTSCTSRFVKKPDGERFTINNNYHPYLARRLVAENPEYANRLKMRETRY